MLKLLRTEVDSFALTTYSRGTEAPAAHRSGTAFRYSRRCGVRLAPCAAAKGATQTIRKQFGRPSFTLEPVIVQTLHHVAKADLVEGDVVSDQPGHGGRKTGLTQQLLGLFGLGAADRRVDVNSMLA